jgi:hypothetical protein
MLVFNLIYDPFVCWHLAALGISAGCRRMSFCICWSILDAARLTRSSGSILRMAGKIHWPSLDAIAFGGAGILLRKHENFINNMTTNLSDR